jgi:predicted Zn-dependent protease with MMP-like domain
MEREEFEQLVGEGYERLSELIRDKIRNVAVLVEDEPAEAVRKENDLGPGETLLGLYHGIPLAARGSEYGVGPTLPDTITLYQKPIEEECAEEEECIKQQVCDTIWHEVAHHFGMDEPEVRRREGERGDRAANDT